MATNDPTTTALVSSDTNTVTNAANRDYAVPTAMALRADRPFPVASSGYAGTASDGLTQLDASHALTTSYASAANGNVVQTARVAPGSKNDGDDENDGVTLALGFGASQAAAVQTAESALQDRFDKARRESRKGW